MRGLFWLGLEEYIFLGGYPRALAMRDDEVRWGRYIRDSLIETVLSRGATPEGVCDLIGYMDEICSDWYDAEFCRGAP